MLICVSMPCAHVVFSSMQLCSAEHQRLGIYGMGSRGLHSSIWEDLARGRTELSSLAAFSATELAPLGSCRNAFATGDKAVAVGPQGRGQ